ncbi:MAG: hypothetical protein CVU84_10995 [Firmicutes bacterium HGW-Firmicutes-1]|jgi:chaperonin cofactor prefoldin|nr:MAG: hypothetical protein CVU84_10995 [Firmicutes bacterium HGW-Firmicutes-1]
MKKLKGSLTIEAALVFPMFLMVVFSVIYFIKIIYIYEQIQFAITEVANQIAVGAYILDDAGILDLQQETYNQAKGNVESATGSVEDVLQELEGLTQFKVTKQAGGNLVSSTNSEEGGSWSEKLNNVSKEISSIKNQIEERITGIYNVVTEAVECIQILTEDSKQMIVSMGVVPGMEIVNNAIGSKVTNTLFNQYITENDYINWGIINEEKGMDFTGSQFFLKDEDVCIVVRYQIEMPFLKGILEPITITQAVRSRAYTGNGNFNSKLEKAQKLNEEGKESIVYVTKKGTKYHTDRSCHYIDIKIKDSSYGAIKDNETICEVCAKNGLVTSDSAIVYSTDASDIFHTSNTCWTIKRDVMTITLDEALDSGYTHCSKCKEGGK